MYRMVGNVVDDLLRYAGSMGRQEWLIVLAVVVVVGLVSLRGFGTRANY